jgi:hypothetical protein
MRIEKIFLLLILIMCFTTVFGINQSTPLDTVWNGSIIIEFTKSQFDLNEPISGKIIVRNDEPYPLFNGLITMHIATGEFSYPSQFDLQSNICLEEKITIDWILPENKKEYSFSLNNPGGGEYRLDTYVGVMKSTLVGSSAIMLSPISKTFSVSGPEEKRAKIIRSLTKFNQVAGPVGFPTSPEDEVLGQVYIYNDSNITKKNMKLKISICDWTDSFCDSVEEKIFDVPDLESTKSIPLAVLLTTPKESSAYTINMVLENEKEIESIYKNRLIVTGPSGKIRKIYLDGLKTKNYSTNIFISGSPDHFTYPKLENFDLTLELFLNNKKIEDKKISIDSIDVEEVLLKKFSIDSKNFDYACIKIIKEDIIYDEECLQIQLDEVQKKYDDLIPKEPIIEWNYNETNEILSFKINKENEMLDVRVSIISTEKTFYEKNISEIQEYSENIYLKKDNYILLIDDFSISEQFQYDLLLNVEDKTQAILGDVPYSERELFECNGIICNQGEVCAGITYNSNNGQCCTTYCQPILNPISKSDLIIPGIFWVGLILFIIALFTGSKVLKKKGLL